MEGDGMQGKYIPQQIEKKWQQIWEETKAFETHFDPNKKKYYVLEMFPYPSGNLHMGHVRNYSIGDVVARFKSMQGFNVIHPMGYDAFGMPAENAAIQHGIAPAEWTYANIENMTRQQKELGLSYDWEREVLTCREDYYKHTQNLFEIFYKRGLAYKKEAKVNWCDHCHTVLANEQVEEGKCWRCKNPVVKKNLSQWFLKITDYADRLLADLDHMPGWPERVKIMQRNWIGRSIGTQFFFHVDGMEDTIPVYTTRVDTVYGVTYIVLAPEHPLVEKLISNNPEKEKIQAFIQEIKNQNDIDRTSEDTPKLGMPTGSYAVHPLTGERVPIWIANYVLYEYGTGAVMAVPQGDQRDWDFAKKYNLPVKIVIQNKAHDLKLDKMDQAYCEDGELVNSSEFDGQLSAEARINITKKLEKMGIGEEKVNYRLFLVNAIGDVRFRLLIARIAAAYLCRKKNCRLYYLKMSILLPVLHRLLKQVKVFFIANVRSAERMPFVKRIQWILLLIHHGISCGIAIRIMNRNRLVRVKQTIGCRWISISAVLNMRFFIYYIPVSS